MKEKNLKTQGLEGFLKSDFLKRSQTQPLSGYKVLKK